jgi:hypothetical protein
MRCDLQTCLLAAALFGIGCSAEKDGAPTAPDTAREVVIEAAQQTFATETLGVKLDVEDADHGWAAVGLVEPMRGRFRIEGEVDGAEPGATNQSKRATVVGTSGEGFEETFYETNGGLGVGQRDRAGKRCWFNPHAPVGFYGRPLSVEETVRLSGSVLESLRSELRAVEDLGTEQYLVELEGSATRPRDDFRDTGARVWGDRNLLANVQRPIEVRLDRGMVGRIVLTLSDYEGERIIGPRPESDRIRIVVSLAEADKRLVAEPPECQAIE